MADQVEVIVGTYEGYTLGYKVEYSKDAKLSLSPSFATQSHSACVKCLAVSGKYLASGGADDRIFIYDMSKRREVKPLTHHEGTVNTVEFTPEATHILSGGDDGKIFAIRVNTWQTQAEWKKAHGGAPVTNIKCHPTGKLAISLGKDITLRSWNLIKGRYLYTTNLKGTLGRIADGVAWSKFGRYFTLTGDRVVQIWKIENASKCKEQLCDSRPTSVCWLTDEEFVVGLENGKIMLLTTDVDKRPIYFDAHKQRVKAIAYVNEILATISSSGHIALWNLDLENYSLKQICICTIGCRPTCIALIDLTQFDDDYVLKQENKETANQTEKLSAKSIRSLESTGSVTVEYEEVDVPLLERSINLQLARKTVKIPKRVRKRKYNIIGRRSNKCVNKWIESPISQIPLADKDKKTQWTETPIKGKLIKDTLKVTLKRKTISNDSITSPKVKFPKESDSPDAEIKTLTDRSKFNYTMQISDDFEGFENSIEKGNKNSPNKVNVLSSKKDEKVMLKERNEKFVKNKEQEKNLEYNLEKLLRENEKQIQLIEENSNKKKMEKPKNNIEEQDENLKNEINKVNTEEEIKQNKISKKAIEKEKDVLLSPIKKQIRSETPSKQTRSKILFSPSKQTRSQTAKSLAPIDLRIKKDSLSISNEKVKESKQEKNAQSNINADNEVMEKKTLKPRRKRDI